MGKSSEVRLLSTASWTPDGMTLRQRKARPRSTMKVNPIREMVARRIMMIDSMIKL
jgi:hypothetical protein